MCWMCKSGLEDDHDGDPGAITTDVLKAAAEMTGTDVPQVVARLVLALSQFSPEVAKAEVSDTASYQVVKSESERQFTLGLAYPAMKADASKAADGHRDFVGPEALENTAWTWLEKYRDVNLFHSDDPAHQGHFTPTESYIYRGPDWPVTSPVDGKTYVIKGGDWLLGGLWDDYGWMAVKERLVNGWSPEGTARRDLRPVADRLAQLRS